MTQANIINCAEAVTLPGLFRLRIERSPDAPAYRQFEPAANAWQSLSWRAMGERVARWRRALASERLAPGERLAILLANSVEWVCFDQAALSLGLVVVPLYTTDTPGNLAFVLGDSGAKVLLLGNARQWGALRELRKTFPDLARVLCLKDEDAPDPEDTALWRRVTDWLAAAGAEPAVPQLAPDDLATLIYTSGTTGRPKGVMLSHRNILWNAEAVLKVVVAYPDDVFLSFLPLSHAFERTVGYYLPVMAGASVAYARSIMTLGEDLVRVRPTVLIAVPRVFENIHARVRQQLARKPVYARWLFEQTVALGWRRFEAMQGRGPALNPLQQLAWGVLRRLVADKVQARLGGRLRLAVSGGAPIHHDLAHWLLGLGVPLLQGYGLTETAPVITANLIEDNIPESVGRPLPGVEIKLGDNDELLVRAPSVMLGYWNQPEATAATIDAHGWLHTGDQARIEAGHVAIRGRLKEILVTSSGEKAPPADLELAIIRDPLFEQAMVVGEGRPYLAALVVLNGEEWQAFAARLGVDANDPQALNSPAVTKAALARIATQLRDFPAYAQVRAVWLSLEPWTVDNGLLTPTLKLKRPVMQQRHAAEIAALYARLA